ncbi:MAG: DUF4252 domain-containing protein, partial [bacterium]|nr:DUF4252 domain-containing protein [bacterium]
MIKRTLCWLVVLGALIPAAWAQTDPDLTSFEHALGDRVVAEILFDGEQLLALAGASQEMSPELSAVVAGVESVRARICTLDPGEAEAVLASLADTAGQLRKAGWATLVDVRGSEQRIEVLLRMDQGHILGFVALFIDGDAGGFARLAGDIDMQQVMTMA